MNHRREHDHLDTRVRARLGLPDGLPRDLDGLRVFYRAWCDHVPFDNVRKMIALKGGTGGPLPGGDPDDFLGHWLAHGTGGTCWPSNNALFAVARALGFDARRAACSMGDSGSRNHGTTIARVTGTDWMVDSSMLTNQPLPLGPEVFVIRDPVFAAEVEPDGGAHVVWTPGGGGTSFNPCRVLVDPVDHDFCLAAYEASRETSPFNHRLYARRNHPGEVRALIGRTRISKRAGGVERRDLSSDALCAALVEDMGLSEEIVGTWARSGALEATFEADAAPKRESVVRKAPSQR